MSARLILCSVVGAAWLAGCRPSTVASDAPDAPDVIDVASVDATREDVASDADVDVASDTDVATMSDGSTDALGDLDVRADVGADAAGDVARAEGGGDADAPFFPADFVLPDLNTHSTTHRMDVSPRALRGRVTAWYFATAT
ncbi:MAG: hypothetical protein Q8Q09_06945 [Deltaproteobacteria bacterium]|nr:hypothetical protein [Deltaproteobacteria bacterium]